MMTPFPGEEENWSLITTYSTAQELHDLCDIGNLIKNISDYEEEFNSKGYLYCHKGILKSYIGTTGPIIHRRQRDHSKKRAVELLEDGDVEFWVAPIDGSESRRKAIENYYIFTYKHIHNLINESFTPPPLDIRNERRPILTVQSIFDTL